MRTSTPSQPIKTSSRPQQKRESFPDNDSSLASSPHSNKESFLLSLINAREKAKQELRISAENLAISPGSVSVTSTKNTGSLNYVSSPDSVSFQASFVVSPPSPTPTTKENSPACSAPSSPDATPVSSASSTPASTPPSTPNLTRKSLLTQSLKEKIAEEEKANLRNPEQILQALDQITEPFNLVKLKSFCDSISKDVAALTPPSGQITHYGHLVTPVIRSKIAKLTTFAQFKAGASYARIWHWVTHAYARKKEEITLKAVQTKVAEVRRELQNHLYAFSLRDDNLQTHFTNYCAAAAKGLSQNGTKQNYQDRLDALFAASPQVIESRRTLEESHQKLDQKLRRIEETLQAPEIVIMENDSEKMRALLMGLKQKIDTRQKELEAQAPSNIQQEPAQTLQILTQRNESLKDYKDALLHHEIQQIEREKKAAQAIAEIKTKKIKLYYEIEIAKQILELLENLTLLQHFPVFFEISNEFLSSLLRHLNQICQNLQTDKNDAAALTPIASMNTSFIRHQTLFDKAPLLKKLNELSDCAAPFSNEFKVEVDKFRKTLNLIKEALEAKKNLSLTQYESSVEAEKFRKTSNSIKEALAKKNLDATQRQSLVEIDNHRKTLNPIKEALEAKKKNLSLTQYQSLTEGLAKIRRDFDEISHLATKEEIRAKLRSIQTYTMNIAFSSLDIPKPQKKKRPSSITQPVNPGLTAHFQAKAAATTSLGSKVDLTQKSPPHLSVRVHPSIEKNSEIARRIQEEKTKAEVEAHKQAETERIAAIAKAEARKESAAKLIKEADSMIALVSSSAQEARRQIMFQLNETNLAHLKAKKAEQDLSYLVEAKEKLTSRHNALSTKKAQLEEYLQSIANIKTSLDRPNHVLPQTETSTPTKMTIHLPSQSRFGATTYTPYIIDPRRRDERSSVVEKSSVTARGGLDQEIIASERAIESLKTNIQKMESEDSASAPPLLDFQKQGSSALISKNGHELVPDSQKKSFLISKEPDSVISTEIFTLENARKSLEIRKAQENLARSTLQKLQEEHDSAKKACEENQKKIDTVKNEVEQKNTHLQSLKQALLKLNTSALEANQEILKKAIKLKNDLDQAHQLLRTKKEQAESTLEQTKQQSQITRNLLQKISGSMANKTNLLTLATDWKNKAEKVTLSYNTVAQKNDELIASARQLKKVADRSISTEQKSDALIDSAKQAMTQAKSSHSVATQEADNAKKEVESAKQAVIDTVNQDITVFKNNVSRLLNQADNDIESVINSDEAQSALREYKKECQTLCASITNRARLVKQIEEKRTQIETVKEAYDDQKNALEKAYTAAQILQAKQNEAANNLQIAQSKKDEISRYRQQAEAKCLQAPSEQKTALVRIAEIGKQAKAKLAKSIGATGAGIGIVGGLAAEVTPMYVGGAIVTGLAVYGGMVLGGVGLGLIAYGIATSPSQSNSKSALTFISGLALIGLGVACCLTGIGAVIGLPLIVAGGSMVVGVVAGKCKAQSHMTSTAPPTTAVPTPATIDNPIMAERASYNFITMDAYKKHIRQQLAKNESGSEINLENLIEGLAPVCAEMLLDQFIKTVVTINSNNEIEFKELIPAENKGSNGNRKDLVVKVNNPNTLFARRSHGSNVEETEIQLDDVKKQLRAEREATARATPAP